ncbi:UDP-N-acetylmuramate dehydrogenase [Collinsella sp. AGMB00827]|uniref:UDP-N-acetylenolpyruvoylglucosamine reductase n=1 Tax=Collinsella ureilytica TaxID=2869515 RepID=A0ABS7MJN4_9ACTN|nr:UDP-N-acetylmuramate dehydrogenase [Collinsella urealyticum]MBY4797243.1 UDP-N-acetylmuramate dehydrogenase [Collinsella urealyticum]
MHEYDSFNEEVLAALGAVVGEDGVLLVEPMREHTTFQVGGSADVVVLPRSEAEAVRALDIVALSELPLTVVGNGSDLLVGDRGIRGIVILFRENMSEISVEGTRVRAQAGALLRDLALSAAEAGLSGLEPLWGIPATVGGACHMNAGAYGGQIADVLESVRVWVPGETGYPGSVKEISVKDLHLGYRKSLIAEKSLVVLSATFALMPDDACAIQSAMDEFRRRREEKQPLEMPSAGSTFKRPEGYFAGKLIMDAGLRGARVGAAQVSEKHCGFVINTGGARAKDVRALIEHVQAEVKRQFGVELEREVKLVGEF